MIKRTRVAFAVLVIATLAMVGCSSDDKKSDTTTAPAVTTGAAATTQPAATTAAAAGQTLTIENFAFSGGPFTAGEPITVINKDTAPHTVTSDDGSFEEVKVGAGETGELMITAAGDYPIHCAVHPTRMTATITVT